QAAYEIANLTGYQCRVYLPFDEWRQVEIGQPVNFRVSNHPEVTGRGRVSQISPRLDPATGLGEVVISLTEEGQNIYQGVLVETTINVQTRENAVVIPRAALVENVQTLIEPESNTIQLQRSYSVFVVKDDTLATQRELQLGIEQGDRIEVLEGLRAGEQVVITGQNSLNDSSKVRVAGQEDFESPEDIPIENPVEPQASRDTSSTSSQ
ncbi:MAG: HlyD family efflux transporter periplasmic adaptor subunit, partial [Balneolaceae bacterium]|nr:HlyD family efflux transporter periplasmic adaptor subunit [Balneolaceae bacterium]